jgi:hypothetical protein
MYWQRIAGCLVGVSQCVPRPLQYVIGGGGGDDDDDG